MRIRVASAAAMIALAIAFNCFAQSALPVQELKAAGIYYRNGDKWAKLEPLVPSAAETRGYDANDLRALIVYRGARAPVQFAEKRPVLVVKRSSNGSPIYSARNAIFVRLKPTSDSREIQMTHGSPLVGSLRAGFDKDDVIEATTSELQDGAYSITPVRDLEPGEYMLVWGLNSMRFDFGINS